MKINLKSILLLNHKEILKIGFKEKMILEKHSGPILQLLSHKWNIQDIKFFKQIKKY